jgi:poly(3-hydroxybutyrate) depolymerase
LRVLKVQVNLEAEYNIDSTRIYADGMSIGGGMAFALSCRLSDRIAAVGAVAAAQDATRANSHKLEVSGASHSVYVSRPKEVAALIEEAASHAR